MQLTNYYVTTRGHHERITIDINYQSEPQTQTRRKVSLIASHQQG